jgi:hypothetical protein
MNLRWNDATNKSDHQTRSLKPAQRRQFFVLGLSLVGLMAFIIACNSKPASPTSADNKTPAPQSASAVALSAQKERGMSFPDFGFMVKPADYIQNYSDQPIFRLKADFPKEKPEHVPAFVEQIDFKKNPKEYLLAARDYAFEGNLPDWDPFKNHIRGWYHIPWLHPTTTGPEAYPPNGGTEGFRGLIKEAPVTPYQLGPDQKGKDGNYSVYAITLVNDMAGYTMGKMWADPNNPDPRATDARYGGGFPIGTVFAKLLFTDAPQGTDKIAYLENPLQWKAYITENFWKSSTRKVTPVNLLQMDIAVRDARADAPGLTGWVFGTFVYNGQLNNQNKFLNLVPVGLMWGDDPDSKTNVTSGAYPVLHTMVNPDLKETAIFDSKDLPPQHLGWNFRLNGPADLNTTSCMGCHVAAQYPAVTSLVPPTAVPDGQKDPPAKGGTPEWMPWFQNLRCATSMNEHTYSTDFSFQVAIALENFFNARSAIAQGAWASDYELHRQPIARGELVPVTRAKGQSSVALAPIKKKQ